MNDEDKNQFDALVDLRKLSWDSFEKRREYEWKMCIAIWTASSAFIVFALSQKINLSLIAVTTFVILVLAGFIYWTVMVTKANRLDRTISFHWSGEMRTLANAKYSAEILSRLEAVRNRKFYLKHWSHIYQVLITFLFLSGCIAATHVSNRLSSDEPAQFRCCDCRGSALTGATGAAEKNPVLESHASPSPSSELISTPE